jgi:hydroxyacylglutathione hydrolase
MWNSLLKIRNLPKETQVYCGHEYSKSNADFAISIEKNNNQLLKRSDEIKKLINKNSYTVPTTIEKEIESNPFLRADNDNIKKNLQMEKNSPEEVFGEIRKRKDIF